MNEYCNLKKFFLYFFCEKIGPTNPIIFFSNINDIEIGYFLLIKLLKNKVILLSN